MAHRSRPTRSCWPPRRRDSGEVRVWEVARLAPATDAMVSAAAPAGRTSGGADAPPPFVERPTKPGEDRADSVLIALAYSPDGRVLATAGEDQTITLRDPQTRKVEKTLTGHSDIIAGLAFAANGKTLASASYDKTVRLWDVASGKEKAAPSTGMRTGSLPWRLLPTARPWPRPGTTNW